MVVRILAVVLLAVVYYAAARMGFRATVGSPVVSTLWAPSGLALFALLRFGTWLWPGVALAAFLANTSGGVPPGGAALIAVGNTLEGLLGRFLLLRVAGFRRDLLRLRDVGALVGLAAVLSPIVSATIGVASLVVSGSVRRRHRHAGARGRGRGHRGALAAPRWRHDRRAHDPDGRMPTE